MIITAAHITRLSPPHRRVFSILVMPRLLNIVVAVYLIIVGLMGLQCHSPFGCNRLEGPGQL